MASEIDAASAQIQGRRSRQEDALALHRYGPHELLAVIGDGLGGHPAGDVASREGVDSFVQIFRERHDAAPDGPPKDWLRAAVTTANQRLIERQKADTRLAGMATTLVAVYIRERALWAATVGDSFLMLLRNERLSLLNELHAIGGSLTSSLGYNLARVDLADGLALQPGDRLLLATDGLAPLGEEDTARIAGTAETAQAAAQGLVEALEELAQPNQDNATVIALLL
ncbi:MAG TPA: PP2C family serine/threonine-protein phosphatase [Candidatus Binatia bacterium]|nr:PP2C family serine/threonine-protein phosphatase [Candidatus Binatia bacterium]